MNKTSHKPRTNKGVVLGIIQNDRKNNKTWKQFEVLVAKIEKFLCPLGAIITAPDKIPDPITGTVREIDATIRYKLGSSELIVAIECRKRNSKQDVMWVEQLYGKKLAFGFGMMIGVSSEGFSEEAKKKAKIYGMQLRKIDTISKTDILSMLTLHIDYFGYRTTNMGMEFYDDCGYLGAEYIENLVKEFGINSIKERKILHHYSNGEMTKVSAMDIFLSHFYKLEKDKAFESIEILMSGESPGLEIEVPFSDQQLYLQTKNRKLFIRILTFKFVVFNKKESIGVSEQVEYVDAQSDEKIATVAEFVNLSEASSYKKFTYKVDVKTDKFSLIGEMKDGKEVDFTSSEKK